MTSFTISEFTDDFVKLMNQEDILFKSQYKLESLASVSYGFTYTLAHDYDNNVTVIVWIPSYICANFERVWDHLSIDEICASVCSAKQFCYVSPFVLKTNENTNVVCEGFLITETQDALNFILESLCTMYPYVIKIIWMRSFQMNS